jgi:casein kinase II subunit alpha
MSYKTFLDEEQERILAAIHIYIEERDNRKRFELVEDEEITSEDKVFLCDVMQLDPMERPKAKELLKHRWFDLP